MTTRFLLIRHGQSEWNAAGRWQGQADPPLSAQGADESKRAAETLAGFSGPIVSSDLRRASQTADIIAAASGQKVELHKGLREIDVGEWSGLTRDEINARFPGAVDDWRAGRLDRPHGGEERDVFRRRIVDTLEALADAHRGAEVLTVTHGGAIHVLERHLGLVGEASCGNLCGRWFEVGDELRSASERVGLLLPPPSSTIRK